MATHHRNSDPELLLSVVTFVFVFSILTRSSQQQQQQQVECGRSIKSSRIVGGSETIANEFPWMVHFLVRDTGGSDDGRVLFSCGGTLISNIHVLTATHCVAHDDETRIYDVHNITLGAHDIGATTVGDDEDFRQVVGWKTIVIPADDDHSMDQDIAIITLSEPVAFTDHVRPACLPLADDSDHVNESVVLTGWGEYNSFIRASSVLRKIETTVLSGDQCRQATGGKFPNLSNDNIICSEGGSGQRRYCKGDDGGPMNYYIAEWDRWFVLGVAGRGDSSVKCSTDRKPNVFTRLKNRLDFIRKYSDVVPPTLKSDTTESIVLESSTTTPTIKNTTTSTTTTTTTDRTVTTTTRPSSDETESTREESTITSTAGNATTATTLVTTKGLNLTGMLTTKTTTVTSTVTTATTPNPFSCADKTGGNYPNPASSCSADFFMCSNGYSYPVNCATGLIYRAETGNCDWPANVAGCH